MAPSQRNCSTHREACPVSNLGTPSHEFTFQSGHSTLVGWHLLGTLRCPASGSITTVPKCRSPLDEEPGSAAHINRNAPICSPPNRRSPMHVKAKGITSERIAAPISIPQVRLQQREKWIAFLRVVRLGKKRARRPIESTCKIKSLEWAGDKETHGRETEIIVIRQ